MNRTGKIGKYVIERELGSGTMGTVFLGYDSILDQRRAIKVMKAGGDNEELRNRFFLEARAAAKLDHPNILRIFDLDLDANKHPYIVMEYVEGEDLKTYIDQKRFLPFAQKIQIIVDVCLGLAHAHKHQIVHRDIKPGNIRINQEGKAKILDFGLARLGSPADSITAGRTGGIVGSPYYMSPEQWRGRDIDNRSDIFSLCAVLYEVITYIRPFEADDISAVMTRIVSEPHVPLRESLPGCAAELSEILDRGLAKVREQRFKDCGQLSQSLQVFITNLPSHLEEIQKSVAGIEADFDRRKQRLAELHILAFLETPLFEKGDTIDENVLHAGSADAESDYGVLLQRQAYLQQRLKSHDEKFHAGLPLLRLLQTSHRQLELGQLDACEETLRQLLRASPKNPSALRLLQACRHAMEETRRKEERQAEVESALSQAREAFQLGDFRRASEMVDAVLKFSPSNSEASRLRDQIRERERHALADVKHRAAELLEICRARLRDKQFAAALKASRELMDLTATFEAQSANARESKPGEM